MVYFPFFMDIARQKGLVVGGGHVARRKVEKLLPYGARLWVCAPHFVTELAHAPVTLLRRPFGEELLEDADFVIAASDDHALNRRISSLCRSRKIPVNVVDDREGCTFLFPALVQRGSLSIGISTGGASPTAAVYLKRKIDAMVPENFDELLAYLDSLRGRFKAEIPEERARSCFFARLFARCLERDWPLEEQELAALAAQVEEAAL